MTRKECNALEEELLRNGYVCDLKITDEDFQMFKGFDYQGKIYQGRCCVTYTFKKKESRGYEVKIVCEIAIMKRYLYKVQIVFSGNMSPLFVENAMKDFMDNKPKEDDVCNI